jgi:uncharacterized protein YqeY
VSELKKRISDATIVAMKAREKARVATLRMVNSEIKRVEVDDRRELTDADVLDILKRMLKQRQDSMSQFEKAGRDDLVSQEASEIELIQEFLPEQLSNEALGNLVDEAIQQTGAAGMADMGRVMAAVKQLAEGRADMGVASGLVKTKLSGS